MSPILIVLAAELNGTVYIYGGEAKTSGDQDTDTWSKYCLDCCWRSR